ncbi:DivIVA domain-containing protein [Candidatus Poribacteria bacterium]|nr:DivIVA domain-containing protein [Candidatus Poribacteria bacterium]
MKMSPDDIRRQKFEMGFRGYNNQEVDTFLQLFADDYEACLKNNDKLTKEVSELRIKSEEYKKKEDSLEKALVMAQRSADQTINESKKEAEKIVRDAELNSEKIIGRAEIKAMEIKDEIYELQRQRDQFISQIKHLTDSLNNYINTLSTYEEKAVDSDKKESRPITPKEPKAAKTEKSARVTSEFPEFEAALLDSTEDIINDIDLENNPDITTTTTETE